MRISVAAAFGEVVDATASSAATKPGRPGVEFGVGADLRIMPLAAALELS